jgi:hypothetical protein
MPHFHIFQSNTSLLAYPKCPYRSEAQHWVWEALSVAAKSQSVKLTFHLHLVPKLRLIVTTALL